MILGLKSFLLTGCPATGILSFVTTLICSYLLRPETFKRSTTRRQVPMKKFDTRPHRVLTLGKLYLVVCTISITICPALRATAAEYLPGIEWEEPRQVTPGKNNQDPPSDAVILFDGVDTNAWNNAETWSVTDGSLIVGKGMISTKETFGDCQLHVEWSSPLPAEGTGQGRGNSGVFFGPYEIQVLDSFENATYFDGQAAAIYKQTPPLVNVMRKPGAWNSYDIIWNTPRFDAEGGLTEPATVTVLHNGVLVQNNFELLGDTPFNRPPRYRPHPPELPIRLQDHRNPVRFRNIWVRKIAPIQGKRTQPPTLRDEKKSTKRPKKG